MPPCFPKSLISLSLLAGLFLLNSVMLAPMPPIVGWVSLFLILNSRLIRATL